MLKSFLIALGFTLGVCGVMAFLVWGDTHLGDWVCMPYGVLIFTGIWSIVHACLYE